MTTETISPDVIYSRAGQVLFSFSAAATALITGSKAPAAAPATVKEENRLSSLGRVAPWGDDNLFPDTVLDIIAQNPTLSASFAKRFRQCYASGVIAKKWATDADGNDVKIRARFAEFDTFNRRNAYGRQYNFRAVRDVLRFYLAAPELILSADRKEIVTLHAHPAKQFRYGLQNEKTGAIETGYLSADWKGARDEEKALKRPVLEDGYDLVERLRESGDTALLFPVRLPTDETYYPRADWYPLLKSEWLDINNNEPKLIKFLIENKATVNYMIEVKDWYWSAKYANWSSLKDDEKTQKKQGEVETFSKMVAGMANAGKSMMVDVKTLAVAASGTFNTGANLKEAQPAWEIKLVPQNKFDGSLKEDSNTARMEIMFAVDLDPSLFGSVPQQNRQGGSDKGQSFNIGTTMDEYFRQLILAPYYLIRDYNGWPSEMEFDFELPVLQTLAAVPPKQRDVRPQE